jgi:hypothetical protein
VLGLQLSVCHELASGLAFSGSGTYVAAVFADLFWEALTHSSEAFRE